MGDVLGNSMDMRGGHSKKSDEAGKAIKDMGRSEFLPFLFYLLLVLSDVISGDADC
jgi:hypothetical protein